MELSAANRGRIERRGARREQNWNSNEVAKRCLVVKLESAILACGERLRHHVHGVDESVHAVAYARGVANGE